MADFGQFVSAFRRRHPAVAWLMGVNIAVSVLIWTLTVAGWIFGFDTSFTVGLLSLPSSPWLLAARPWTALTYMVTHYSPLHLLFNMLWLYWFAALFESLSTRKLLLLYIGGGLVGGAAFLGGVNWLSPASYGATLCGASASVMSVMAAAAVLSPDRRIRLLLFGAVKLKWLALAAILLSFLGMGGGNAGGQYAHIGGVLFGVVATLCMSGFRRFRSRRRRRVPRIPSPEQWRIDDVERASRGRLSDPERLDQLLDKIRLSGFDALTASEKAELMAISARLDK